jgi:hypothetical protein
MKTLTTSILTILALMVLAALAYAGLVTAFRLWPVATLCGVIALFWGWMLWECRRC